MSNLPTMTGHIKIELLTSDSNTPAAYFEWWLRKEDQSARLREAAAFLQRLAAQLESGDETSVQAIR